MDLNQPYPVVVLITIVALCLGRIMSISRPKTRARRERATVTGRGRVRAKVREPSTVQKGKNVNPILNFKAIVGVVPGYAKDNDPPMPPPTLDQALAIASGAWDKVAEEVHALVATAGLIGYVSAFFTAGKVVYRKDWGCPEGGEVSVQITGEKNPMFPAPKDTIWTLLVIETFRRVKLALGQSSLTVYLPRACVDMRNGKMTFMDEMDSEGPTVMDETDSLIPLIRNLATKDGK